MELEKTLSDLLFYWKEQNIKLTRGCSDKAVKLFESKMNIILPSDFVHFFKVVNGMELLYPNDSDENGFLFYPLQGLKTIEANENKGISHLKDCLIFANYMQNSWEYYIKILGQNNYEIGIRPASDVFKSIANSLSKFIRYYITDDEILYTYELNKSP